MAKWQSVWKNGLKALGALGLIAGLSGPAQTQGLLLNGQQQFLDSNGDPLAAGSVYFYIPNTTTPKTTYQDYNETVPNTNPVVLNSAGRAVIWGTGLYRQVVYDQYGNLIWDQQTYAPPSPSDATSGSFGAQQTVASATTTNIGAVATNNVLVTGSSTIASFGSSASLNTPVYLVTFQNPLTLVYNATSMVLPGARNISVKGGDAALMLYAGGGNWQMVEWLPRANDPTSIGFGTVTEITDAATVDLGTASGNYVKVLGSGTNITSFGTSASTQRPLFLVLFDGTEGIINSGNIIIPGGSIGTAQGDTALVLYQGAGVWRIIQYTRAAQTIGNPRLRGESFRSVGSSTYTIPSDVDFNTTFELTCVGPGGGGGSSTGGSGSAAGGGGAGGYQSLIVSGFTGLTDLTVFVGTGGSGSSSAGANGSAGSAATTFTYNGVTFMSCGAGSGGVSANGSLTSVAGGAGGTVSTNFPGSGLTLQSTMMSLTGQAGGYGRYQGNSIAQGGAGGGNPVGPGAVPAYSNLSAASGGFDGGGYGAGGGGGASGLNAQNTGGSGSNGAAWIRGVY